MKSRHAFLALMVAATIVNARNVGATPLLRVEIDTRPLIDHAAAPFFFAIALTDGDGVGGGNNEVTISQVALNGGLALGGGSAVGGVDGSLSTSVRLRDSEFGAFYFEAFRPGNALSFLLQFTTNANVGDVPDRLSFALLDSAGIPLPTTAPFGDYLFAIDLVADHLAVETFGGDPSRRPTVGDPIALDAPTLSPVPEPATLSLFATGLVALALRRWRRRDGS
jgi:hypothetical protein